MHEQEVSWVSFRTYNLRYASRHWNRGYTSRTNKWICFIWAFIVFFITALIIGVEGKAKWFQRRTKYTWFNRRGFLGETLFFGYPKTREGYGITFLMASAIGIVGYILYLL